MSATTPPSPGTPEADITIRSLLSDAAEVLLKSPTRTDTEYAVAVLLLGIDEYASSTLRTRAARLAAVVLDVARTP